MTGPDRAFWDARFAEQHTPWDRGAPSPQLRAWLAEGVLAAPSHVAVPGCGSGHEVAVLAEAGLRVTALDYAPAAVALTRERLAQAPRAVTDRAEVIEADVLRWAPSAPFDAVYEQTCLCALHPDDWQAYAAQLVAWLRPGGRLALLAMQARRDNADEGRVEGPPYHVDINALRALFPASAWLWPKPAYPRVDHPRHGWFELAVVLQRR
jgi:SAM-dependent methyltransferase